MSDARLVGLWRRGAVYAARHRAGARGAQYRLLLLSVTHPTELAEVAPVATNGIAEIAA